MAIDDDSRCCIGIESVCCERRSALRITNGLWDGYIYTCVAHVELLLLSYRDSTIEPIPRSILPEQ